MPDGAQRGLAATMRERDLQKLVSKMCGELGLLWHHCRDTRHCEGSPGWPDLAIVGPRGIVFRELKSANERTSTAQLGYGSLIKAAGGDWNVWRPVDLTSDHIARFLHELARK